MEPIHGGVDGASVASEVDENGVAGEDLGVMEEMVHETLFDVVFGGIFVQQHAELVFGNLQVLQKPTLDISRVLDARFQIPQRSRPILVNADN